MRKCSRIALVSVAVAQALGLEAFVLATPSGAQSPTPTWYSENSYPGQNFPPTAPDASHGPNAVVVEGLGSLACTSYTVSSIEFYTDLWINEGKQTITEITPQTVCGNLTEYKNLILGIFENVETSSSNPGRYWAGFMYDEEPGYGFTPLALESLNSGTKSLMDTTNTFSWYFTEDEPNGWTSSYKSSTAEIYEEIVTGSWNAPLVYSTSMLQVVRTACSADSLCTQMVTVHGTATTGIEPPWTDYRTVTGMVLGTPWYEAEWGNGYWWNEYRTG